MRSDMSKVVLEKERDNSREGFRRVRHQKRWTHGDPDELPQRESMKARYGDGWRYKEPSYQSNPMIGFLRKNCGRLWDDVYAEVCRNSPRRLRHFGDLRKQCSNLVEQNTHDLDGKVYVENSGKWLHGCRYYDTRYQYPVTGYWITRMKQVYPVELSWCRFYVHPLTGRLCENVKVRRKLEPKLGNPDVLVADEWCEYHKIAGLWYEIRFSPFPKDGLVRELDLGGGKVIRGVVTPLGFTRDVLLGIPICEMWERVHLPYEKWVYDQAKGYTNTSMNVRPPRFAKSKRALRKKELRKLQLKNG